MAAAQITSRQRRGLAEEFREEKREVRGRARGRCRCEGKKQEKNSLAMTYSCTQSPTHYHQR